jgi:hypothetical protein
MGWLFTQGASRKDIIKHVLQPWENDVRKVETIKHTCVGNTLWAVKRDTNVANNESELYIACYLLSAERNFGWGYKDMDESCCPTQRTCPPSYFDEVPMPNTEWAQQFRDDCRAFYERRKRARSFKDGDVIEFAQTIEFTDDSTHTRFTYHKVDGKGVWVGGNGRRYRLSASCFALPYTVEVSEIP